MSSLRRNPVCSLAALCGIFLALQPFGAGAADTPQSPGVARNRVALQQIQRSAPAPAPIGQDKVAAAVKAQLGLSALPLLSGPFTVTPAKPVVPRTGQVQFVGIDQTAFNMDDPSDPGDAHFHWSMGDAAAVQVRFHALAGSRYALDCSMQMDRQISYQVYLGDFVSGQMFAYGKAGAGPGHHVVFATTAVPQSGIVTAYIDFDNTVGGSADFWGCNVSSF